VHDLVVGDREHVVLAEGVEQAEGDAVVVELAVDRVLGEVVEHVVHPAHVPLHGEAESVQVDGTRHTGERSGFLGDGDGARNGVGQFVEALG
jgi:hypothetical protein